MSQSPAVSVLMAVRNGEKYLHESVASILDQSFSNLELVLIDNGSRDGTASIIETLASHDRRIRPFHLARPGLARSLNLAATRARAPILARLDADDIAERDRLAIQYETLSADPDLGAIGSHALMIDRRGRPLGTLCPPTGREAVRQFLGVSNPFIHSSTMFRRAHFDQVGGYREGLRYTEDLDLWLRLAEISELDVLPHVLVRYRQHRGSIMSRHRLRVVIAETCARTAVQARRRRVDEPFVDGRPRLRAALQLSGQERPEFQRALYDRIARQNVEHHFTMLPIPMQLKPWLRRVPAKIGLRPIYRWVLNLVRTGRN